LLKLSILGNNACLLQQNGTIGPAAHCVFQSWRNRMEQVVDTSNASVRIETPGVSWGAILAGAAAALV
jgi:hypothetical protein